MNIYNDCKHNKTLEMLTEYHRTHTKEILGTTETQDKHHLVWLGDFNRHHPYWDAPENNSLFTHEAMDQAELLIQAVVLRHGRDVHPTWV